MPTMSDTEEYPAEIQAHIDAGGNGIVTLPPGMTQEEADELVRIADEEQARLTAEYEAKVASGEIIEEETQ